MSEAGSQPEPVYEVVSPEPRYVDPPPDFTVGIADLTAEPSPSSGSAGMSKEDVKQHFVDHVQMRAGSPEGTLRDIGMVTFSLEGLVAEGRIPELYARSSDPDRLVPSFSRTKDIGIVVAGDPFRVQSRGYLQNRPCGLPVSRKAERV